MLTIKISLIPYNEELSIKALDIVKHLGLGVILEQSSEYNFKAIYNRFCYEDADIIVGMDEDVFFYNPGAILDIANYMVDKKIPFMAMRELSGVSGHRKKVGNAKECDYNSFLMFTQPALTRPKMIDGKEILSRHTPTGFIEPYWAIFRHLDAEGVRGAEFEGGDHADEISTILTWDEKPFALHTWGARYYTYAVGKSDFGGDQRKRILDRYEEVSNAYKLLGKPEIDGK